MDAIYKQRGNSIDYIPTVDVAAGQVVIANDLVAIAKLDIKAGTLGALALVGVFSVNKQSDTGTAIPFGAKVFWDAANGYATTDADDGGSPAVAYPCLGKCIKAAADEDVTVSVRLQQ